jgi:hypothetical protein
MMDVVLYLGMGLIALSVCVRWWRIIVPLCGTTLLAWAVDAFTPLQTVWFTYPCMAAGLGAGLFWHRLVNRRSLTLLHEPQS